MTPSVRPMFSTAVAALCCSAIATAAAHADEPLAQTSGVTGVSSFHGIAVWSAMDEQGDYRLVARESGRVRVLPVAPRTVPFDVDLGPTPQGDVVAVYSRCRREPIVPVPIDDVLGSVAPLPAYTTGEGCDLFRFNLAEGTESLLAGPSTNESSESLPTIWRGEVAFARVYESRSGLRGQAPYLYANRFLDEARSERIPGSTRGDSGLPGPVDIELREEVLAFTWSYSIGDDADSQRTEMRIVADDGERRVLGRARDTRDTIARYHSPDIIVDRVLYGFQRLRVIEEAIAVPDETGRPQDAVRFVASPRTSLRFEHRLDTEETDVSRLSVDDPLVAASGTGASAVGATRREKEYFEPTGLTRIIRLPR